MRWLLGWLARAAARWPAGPAHLPGVGGHAAGVGERAAQQVFDLGVGAAQFVGGPAGEGVVDRGVEAEQEAFAAGHW